MVVFERKMTITYNVDTWQNVEKIQRQVQYLLHLEGMNQVSRYAWRDKISGQDYGYQTVEDADTEYPVHIETSEAFRLHYLSEAERAVKGLIESGHNRARYTVETTTTEYQQWRRVHGPFFIFNFEGLQGTMDMTSTPSLVYDKIEMVTSIAHVHRGGWELEFIITYNAETIDDRKEASEQLVEVPLSDMRKIRQSVEAVLESFTDNCDLEFMVECVSCIRSETTAKCEPITIEKVMKNEV